jgi:hypothetical protein|eukprot:Tamp_28026.p2 GENE.Tamp_28026~~Tamp_28026.p2  ORF type:complete len:214 (+),score=66.53 Tamp_28026:158-799(+)
MTTLGKRILREETKDWTPGRGLEEAQSTTDAERAAFDRRTSLLFLELQNSVQDALRWRHARDFKARKASHEIAMRCPLPAADAVATVHLVKEELPATVKKTEVKVLTFEEKMKADAAEAKARACARSLPEPLTTAILSAAYKEVPSGAEQTIERVLECWRTNKLSAHDVVSTVKSFSGSSAVLRKLFAEQVQEGEVASAEQMLELSRLAMAAR